MNTKKVNQRNEIENMIINYLQNNTNHFDTISQQPVNKEIIKISIQPINQ